MIDSIIQNQEHSTGISSHQSRKKKG